VRIYTRPTVRVNPMFRGFVPGIAGLGQDDGSSVDVSSGLTFTDPTSVVIPVVTAPVDTYVPDSVTAGLTDAQIQATAAGVQSQTSLNSYVTNPSAAPTTSSGSSAAQILTAAGIASAAAAKGITAASGPYQVPGTSLVYNPATGQIINAAGALVGSAALPSSLNLTSLIGPLVMIVAAVVVVKMVGK
jgi:hypothetical protein